jgi:NADH dehydrogenase [ubiquinone] 1 alpha subcomplex assembly factor 7
MNGSSTDHHDPAERPAPPADDPDSTPPDNPVVARLKARCAIAGHVSVAEFMKSALGDQDGGYYTTRDPFGAAGDFTTAPEISQVFGELIGLWCADTWRAIGSPPAFALIELGPGRGTLMADVLRALRQVPECRAAANIHLVETSPVLRDIQQNTLRDENITWHSSLPDHGRTPVIFLANEFLDALPVEQYIKHQGNWCERVVAHDAAHDRFCFAIDRSKRLPLGAITRQLAQAEEGEIFEYSPAVRNFVSDMAHQVFLYGGAGLIVDYGYTRHATGQTLQAVRRHRPINPLESPGDCDLTAHVDFQLVGDTARNAGVKVWGPEDQSVFLQRLGIIERTNILLKRADVSQAHHLRTAVTRLIAPAEMGTLFKVMAISGQRLSSLAGFETDH